MKSNSFLDLQLVQIDYRVAQSIYSRGDKFPARMAFLHPDCAEAWECLQDASDRGIVLSDMWRASMISLRKKYPPGRLPRRGAAKPAWSGHNYGFSIDIDVSATMENLGMKNKRALDAWMAWNGFHCHRKDHKRKREEWHYNALVVGGLPWHKERGWTTASALEAMIRSTYGEHWNMTRKQIQRSLKLLGLYPGDIDGKFGPLSRQAMVSFQKAWHLKPTGQADTGTQRVLAFRCAELRSPLLKNLWTVA